RAGRQRARRCQDRAAGMGAGQGALAARLYRGRAHRPRPCPAFHHRRHHRRLRRKQCERSVKETRRTQGGGGLSAPREGLAGVHMSDTPEIDTSRCGFVALVGAPNAGKSTLLNALVGTKVSIVTHKAQTTRAQIRGVVTLGQAQLVFIDTPGIFAPKRRLDRAMVDAAWSGAGDADAVALIVVAARGVSPELEVLLTGLADIRQPRVLVLNKIDLIPPGKLLGLSADLIARLAFDQTFMISALKG